MIRYGLIFIVFLALALGLQRLRAAGSGEFSGHDDEAGHFVTGLMIRDYVFSGCPGNPMRYAESYYLHYPKVSLGHWPPCFYLVQLPGLLVFPPGRDLLMVLMAAISASVAMVMVRLVTRLGGSLSTGLGAGSLFLVQPLAREYGALLMSDLLVTLWILLACAAFVRFMETRHWKPVLAFGVWSACAILTKGTGFLLVLLPLGAIPLCRQWRLLKAPALWVAAGIVAALCLPWYAVVWPMMKNGFEQPLGWTAILRAAAFYGWESTRITGAGGFLLALIGVFFSVRSASGSRAEWRGIAGLTVICVATPLFQCFVANAFDTRYLLPMIPSLMVVGAWGAEQGVRQWLAARLDLRIPTRLLTVVALLLAFLPPALHASGHECRGFRATIQSVLQKPAASSLSVWMVSSDARGEGALIAQAALAEPGRPGNRYVLRASKMLARSLWDGRDYESLYQTPELLQAWLERIPVGVIIQDTSMPPDKMFAHHAMLAATLMQYAPRWQLLGRYPVTRDGVLWPDALSVYVLKDAPQRSVSGLTVDLRSMLGRSVSSE